MSEQLEIIDIEGEEYPQIFVKIRELRVFNAMKKAMEQSPLRDLINTLLPYCKIEIGFHDGEFYTIREANT